MASKDETPAEEPVVETSPEEPVETPEEPESGLTEEEQDALLAVNGDVKGELKPNRPLDEDVPEEVETPEETPEEETPEEPAEEVKAPEITPEADEAGVYAPAATDPGEFKPGDYSFDVTTTDGKTRKITSIEQADELLSDIDKNPELISAYQFGILNRKSAVMEQSVAADRRTFEADKAKFDEQEAQSQTREQYLTQWQGEINYLRQKGELPPITSELNQADWTDPAVASQPGVKEALEVFKYMEEENNKRMAAGLQPDLSVMSAYNSMQLEAMRNAEKETDTSAKAMARARGSMVGKKAPYTPSTPTKGTIVGAPQGLDELATQAYYANVE